MFCPPKSYKKFCGHIHWLNNNTVKSVYNTISKYNYIHLKFADIYTNQGVNPYTSNDFSGEIFSQTIAQVLQVKWKLILKQKENERHLVRAFLNVVKEKWV